MAFRQFLPEVGFALLIWTFLYFSKNLEGFRGGWHSPTIFSQVTIADFYLMAFLLALAFLRKHYYSRLLLLCLACLLLVGLISIRIFARRVIASHSWNSASRRAVIMGSGHLANELAYKISRHPEMLLEVVGLLYPSFTDSSNGFSTPPKKLLSIQSLDIHGLLREKNVKELIVIMPQLAGSGAEKVISKCREDGMIVRLVPNWYELYISQAQMIQIDGVPLISLEQRNISVVALGLKRAVDLGGAFFLFILSLPILLISFVCLNRRYDRVFRREIRCGRLGRSFAMFRLNVDRENQRLSRIEKLLIRLSLTELPQLWNVLRGEMSLVGPRPESPERARHYSDWQRQRLSFKPGLTGLAQVHGLRDQHSSQEKSRLDLEYIFNWSLFLDFSLILQTAWTLVVRLLKTPKTRRMAGIGVPKSVELMIKEVPRVDRAESGSD